MSAGETPAVLFYLLDRHALLAMTRGSKRGFLNALPHPPSCFARHPPPWNHPRKLCLRGAQYGGGHFGVDCFGDLLTYAVWIIYVRGLFG